MEKKAAQANIELTTLQLPAQCFNVPNLISCNNEPRAELIFNASSHK